MKERIYNFLATWWQQLIGIPVAVFMFFAAPPILRLLDPTAAAFDGGILHTINVVWVQALVYNALAWIGLIVSFRPLATFFKNDLNKTFYTLTAWEKLKISLAVYFFYLLLFVLLTLAL